MGRRKEGKGRGGSCLESPQKPLMALQSYDSEKRQLVLVWVHVPVFPLCLFTWVSVHRDRCPAAPMTLRCADFFVSLFFLTLNICFIATLDLWLFFYCRSTGEACVVLRDVCCLTTPHYFYICCCRTATVAETGISCSLSSGLHWFYLSSWGISNLFHCGIRKKVFFFFFFFYEVRKNSRPVHSDNILLHIICLGHDWQTRTFTSWWFAFSSLSLKG